MPNSELSQNEGFLWFEELICNILRLEAGMVWEFYLEHYQIGDLKGLKNCIATSRIDAWLRNVLKINHVLTTENQLLMQS